MLWSSIKFVPQKYHNYAVIYSEKSLKLMNSSEKENAVKQLNIKVYGFYHRMIKM